MVKLKLAISMTKGESFGNVMLSNSDWYGSSKMENFCGEYYKERKREKEETEVEGINKEEKEGRKK
jgi:hypothetical protein